MGQKQTMDYAVHEADAFADSAFSYPVHGTDTRHELEQEGVLSGQH